MTVSAARLPRSSAALKRWGTGWTRVGLQTLFYAKTLRYIGDVFRSYRSELVRLIAQMGLGTGALAVIGGTVAIVGFLTMTTGALVSVAGYNQLSDIGVEALTGFASAFFNVRLAAPLTAGVALAATIGAGATAQLGAMRINEEIDALEVMGIRTIAYLASTRVVAGVLVVVPLYCVAAISGSCRRSCPRRSFTVSPPASTTTTSTRSCIPLIWSGHSCWPSRWPSSSCSCIPTTGSPHPGAGRCG